VGDTKFSFKITASDATRSAVNSSKKNLKGLRDEVAKIFKESKKADKPFVDMEKSLKKVGKASEDLADILKNVNKEDEAMAAKLREKGKELEQYLKAPKKGAEAKSLSPVKAMQGASQQSMTQAMTIREVKVDKMTVASSRTGGKGGTPTTKKGATPAGGKPEDTMSGIMGALGKAGIVGAVIMSTVGLVYGIMAAKANAFTGAAGQQATGLQQMGFGSTEGMLGNKKTNVGGFYSGFKGEYGGSPYYMTGQTQVGMMSAFARQTGAGKGRLENMMYGREGGIPMGALSQAYGLNAEQLAGTAGTFERFGQGKKGTTSLAETMAGAESAGMGGARMQEFIDAMQEALTQAVYDGTQRTQGSMLKGLGVLMNTNDERLKALAPEIMKSSTQAMTRAASLQGSPESNFMLQSAINRRKKSGESGTMFDVMEDLASGDWLSNAQAALDESSRRTGGNKQWEAYTFTKAMGLNIASPKMQQDIANMVRKGETPEGKKLSGKNFQEEVQKRLKSTSEVIDKTVKMDYVESLHTISEANKDAAAGINKMKEAVLGATDALYSLGKKGSKGIIGEFKQEIKEEGWKMLIPGYSLFPKKKEYK